MNPTVFKAILVIILFIIVFLLMYVAFGRKKNVEKYLNTFDRFKSDFSFTPTRYQLRVFSQLASNLCILWLSASFATGDKVTLLTNLLFGMVSLAFAILIEKELDHL